MKSITRRDFFKLSGSSVASISVLPSLLTGSAEKKDFKIKYAKETTTICPYCAVGCGIIAHTENNKVINTEGDSDHPINEGSLCSKGSAVYQIPNNSRRLTKVLYRAPKSNKWEEKELDWAITEVAKRIKATRDKSFVSADTNGVTVNRAEELASIGGAALNNEECYLISKLSRALGLVYFEHEARLCHSSTVAALGPSFGRGAMTNHWIDIKNSDCVFIIGSNPAENHPMSFKWIMKAKEKGAKILVADPRFTRSASKSDLYVRFRPGTDIALVGGIINYCISNKLYHEQYVKEYTNASFLVDPNFTFKDGLFSGYDSSKRSYDYSAWDYQKDAQGKPLVDDPKNYWCIKRGL